MKFKQFCHIQLQELKTKFIQMKIQAKKKTNGQPKYQVMDYATLTPLLVKAVQEQQTIIDDLKSRIETLEE